jgi:hypothetical protein
VIALPEPADGDLFFDIEGLGITPRTAGSSVAVPVRRVDTAQADEARLPRYTQIWTLDRPGEKRAFEELIDFIPGHHCGPLSA